MIDHATLSTWLHYIGDTAPHLTEAVTIALRRAGVLTRPLDMAAPLGCGILIFDAAAPQVSDFVRTFTRGGRERLLAITTREGFARAAAWKIMAAGASDVLAWDALENPAEVVVERLRRWQEIDDLLQAPVVRNYVVGQSPGWISLLRQVIEVARFSDASVLLIGETGTGKELIARLIHTLSRERSKRELVLLDCTTIVPDLAGSEMFGHERGSFTGATTARDGAFALAHGGTLFLDEVGELPPALQAQLLRVVQERTYKRVGSNTWQKTDFRLVCATNRDLLDEVERGAFRRDLYYRVAQWTFRLPPLKGRTEDILPLAQHFLGQMHPDGEAPELHETVQEYLLHREYRGNVRDLRNLVQRIAQLHTGRGPITIGSIPVDERPPTPPGLDDWWNATFEETVRRAVLQGARLRDIRRAAEETAIAVALTYEGGNLQCAAHRLGLTDRALQMRRAEQRQRWQAGGAGVRDTPLRSTEPADDETD